MVSQNLLVGLPVCFSHVQAGNVPAPDAQFALCRMHGRFDVALERLKTEIGVLFPVPVAREFGEASKSLFARQGDGVGVGECLVGGVALGDIDVSTSQPAGHTI